MQSEFWAHESTFLYYAAILDLVTMKGWSEGKFAEVAGVPPPLPPSPHTPSDSDCWLVASHSYDAVLMSSPLSLVFEFIGNTFTPKSDFIHSPLMPDNSGADLGGGCRGAHLSPPPSWDEAFFSVFPFKICLPHWSVTSFLRGANPPKKNPGSAPVILLVKGRPLEKSLLRSRY